MHILQNFHLGGLGAVPSNPPPPAFAQGLVLSSVNYGGKLKISLVASGLQSAFETQQWPPSLNGSRKREPSQSPSKCRLLSLVSLQGRTFLAKTMIAFGPFIFPPYLRHHDLSLLGSTTNPPVCFFTLLGLQVRQHYYQYSNTFSIKPIEVEGGAGPPR